MTTLILLLFFFFYEFQEQIMSVTPKIVRIVCIYIVGRAFFF